MVVDMGPGFYRKFGTLPRFGPNVNSLAHKFSSGRDLSLHVRSYAR